MDAATNGRLSRWGPFVLAYLLMLVYGYNNLHLEFRGDAYETWAVASSLWNPEQPYRSFVEYRGFPVFLISALIQKFASVAHLTDIFAFRLFGSLLFAGLAAISLPNLIARIGGREPATLLGKFLSVLLVFYFFRGQFLYPSNDAITVFFLALSLNAAFRNDSPSWVGAAISGAWLALAILCRGNYIVAIPFLLLAMFRFNGGLAFGGVASWVRVVALVLPFFALNAVDGIYSGYRVETGGPAKSTPNQVLSTQLTKGLKIQKIEWNVGNQYPGMLIYEEPIGKRILEENGITTNFMELPDYFSLAARHPLDFIRIYLRHAFGGVDVNYHSTYVTNIRHRSLVFSLLNYTLIFLTLAMALKLVRARRDLRLPMFVAFGAMCLPALACAPFPVEPRFYMSMSMLLAVCPAIWIRKPGNAQWRRPATIALAAAGIVFVLACLALSAHIFESVEGEPLKFHTLP